MEGKPTQIFVVDNWNGTATTSTGTDFETVSASNPTPNNLYAFDENNLDIDDLTVTVPEQVIFCMGDPARGLRQASVIKKGYVKKYTYKPFEYRTPMAYVVDFGNLFAAMASGDKVTFRLYTDPDNNDHCIRDKDFTIQKGASAAAMATLLARLVNESVSQELMQGFWKPISAVAVAEKVYIHETPKPADYKEMNTPNFYTFRFFGVSSYKASIVGSEYEKIEYSISRFEATADVTVLKKFYYAATGVFYNATLGIWYLAGAPTVQITAPGNLLVPTDALVCLNGNGNPAQISSQLRMYDHGYAGIQNKLEFRDLGYDWTNIAKKYDCHIIEFQEVNEYSFDDTKKPKRLIIYIEDGAESDALKTFIETGLMPTFHV